MPYPDLRHFTLRDYGNRVGIYRLLKALKERGVTPTVAMNGQLALRYPALLDAILTANCELVGHGWSMDHLHYGGMNPAEEEALIERSLHTLRERSGQNVDGWLSPARNESENTPDLLAKHGVRWFCDWVNDDMPYRFRTAHGDLWAVPLSNELEDQFVLVNNGHSEHSYQQQLQDAGELLLTETAQQGGRMLGLNLHPWLLGQPHRIGYLERALDHLLGLEGLFVAVPGSLVEHT
jgi:peptidoglycan/xylan/chitin deacetylase (PgdA/CDA1 family)